MRHFDSSGGGQNVISTDDSLSHNTTLAWPGLCLGYKCGFASSSLSNQDKTRMQAWVCIIVVILFIISRIFLPLESKLPKAFFSK